MTGVGHQHQTGQCFKKKKNHIFSHMQNLDLKMNKQKPRIHKGELFATGGNQGEGEERKRERERWGRCDPSMKMS
jgi:hypothetical protein